MSAQNAKYRNPPPPVGYVCDKEPCLIIKENLVMIDGEYFDFMQCIIESGILDVPDVSIYEDFVPNSSSEEEETEIVEVPVVRKAPEVVDLNENLTLLSIDATAATKKGVECEKPHAPSETPEDLLNGSKASISPSHKKISVKKEPLSDEDAELTRKKKKVKKNREKRHSSCSSDSDYYKRCKKSRRIKRRETSYSSDSSSKKTTRSRHSPSPSCSKAQTNEYDQNLTKVKEENNQGLLYGVYHCNVCNITMNSYPTYQSHMTGKRHQKALNAQNVVDSVAKTFVPTEAASRYPKPPPGYYRKRYSGPAKIQAYIDDNLSVPCPGLVNVTEIHSATETSYYCSLCDSHCSTNSILPHLTGFKHQLSCLKHFRQELYDKLCYKQKYQIERQLNDELRKAERKYGRGLIRVEKDYLDDDFPKDEKKVKRDSRRDNEIPSTSHEVPGSELENYALFSMPDRSKSGFYCKLCDSHSNSFSMWQSHVVGKRHLTNLRKAPGTAPSRNKYIPAAPHTRAFLMDFIREVSEPIVGLNQIREIRKPEIDGLTYNCFLCCSCVSDLDIVDHILSRKHREKYLANIQHPEFETLRNFEMRDAALESIIKEICSREEDEKGRGVPEVYFAKRAFSFRGRDEIKIYLHTNGGALALT